MAERRRSATKSETAPEPDQAVEEDQAEDLAEDEDQAAEDQHQAAHHRRRLSAAEAGRDGLEQVTELTGKAAESVTGVKRSRDGWLVTVEVVEDHRIPSSTDILATYEAELDDDGELLSYRRVRRYSRGRGGDNGDY